MVEESDSLESINNNLDYKYQLKNIGMRSLGAPYRSSKGQEAPKLAKWAS